jgi:bifunctional NMN adenylyltransferase/nudix hydrolase
MLSVVIGRFQTPYLHCGHKELFDEAKKYSNRILVLIGVSSATGTDRNPLSYEQRREMIDTSIAKDIMLVFKPLYDFPLSHKDWSNQVDELIEECGDKEVIIFGGRDNSIEGYYSGKHKTRIIKGLTQNSATKLRKQIASQQAIYGHAARSAVIHHIENRYPIVYSTVDIVVYRQEDFKALVGKKGDKYCFVGGFVDPSDTTLKYAAIRELEEETGIKVTKNSVNYIDSIKIDDERYKGCKDSIMTHVFTTIHNHLPDLSKIKDKEFKDFRFIGIDEIDLLHDFHKPIAELFFCI